MVIQKQLLSFQIPFELNSQDSNQSSVLPNSIQRAEKKRIRKPCSEEHKKRIGKGISKIWAKCRKGKTYEEVYGIERAKEIKRKIRENPKRHSFKKGNLPWHTGLTKENNISLKKMSESKKRLYAEGKLIHPMKNKHHSLESIRKMCKNLKGKPAWNKGLKGGIAWNKGLTKESDERVKKYADKKKGVVFTEDHKKKLSLIKQNPSKEKRLKMSLIGLKLWQNPEYAKRIIKAQLKGLLKRPTSFEQKIIDLINKHNLPFKYVGNGDFIIEGKNPDFIETNGRKILIEVFNDFHHQGNYEERRSDILPNLKLRFKDGASSDMIVQDLSHIVPASTTELAFPLLEGRGSISTGVVKVLGSPPIPFKILSEALKSR